MKTKLLRKMCGIGLGLLTSTVLGILIVNIFPFYISEYLPILLGAMVGGLIIKDKPVLVGGMISVLMMGVSILNLLIVGSLIKKSMYIPELNYKIIIQIFLYLPVGLLGGGCAYLLKFRRLGEIKET